MLGDEFLYAAGCDWLRVQVCIDRNTVPGGTDAPCVFDVAGLGGVRDFVPHCYSLVRLIVEGPCEEADCNAWHELADEYDSALSCAVGEFTNDVEAQVDFFKSGMEGEGYALDAHAIEEKSNE
jgi:hypothetical protein